MPLRRICLVSVFNIIFYSQGLCAVTAQQNFAILAGYFQQPTSQYYHQYYGFSYEYRPLAWAPIMRATYAERPKFSTIGYSDQESTYNLLLGGNFYRGKQTYLRAYLGPGVFRGYIEPSSPEGTDVARSYALKGLHVAMDAVVEYGPVFVGLGHEMFVGYVSDDQLEAYVGWPVLFFNARFGMLF